MNIPNARNRGPEGVAPSRQIRIADMTLEQLLQHKKDLEKLIETNPVTKKTNIRQLAQINDLIDAKTGQKKLF